MVRAFVSDYVHCQWCADYRLYKTRYLVNLSVIARNDANWSLFRGDFSRFRDNIMDVLRSGMILSSNAQALMMDDGL